MKYSAVIGLEVHVELKTKSKMFCGCSAYYFGEPPNTHTCPVCLGLPGALPVPNQKAIEWCVMIGLALGCKIPLFSKFDRKNYFYPDLAKGYQISQYDEPFAINGSIKLSSGKIIGVRRAHMEEDTGKLLHEEINGEKVSLIDFNRSGVPLVEIVTEPDFVDGMEVKEYLQKLQQIVRFLGVSEADMEKGEMRLEPNISLRPVGSKNLPKYKVEVKNINSFNFVEDAINFEIKRQSEILENGETPLQETRGWNEDRKKTISQRIKEEANDYRYFPDPDIPPIRWNKSELDSLRKQMPELPDGKFARFVKDYGLSVYNAGLLTKDKSIADYFEEAVKVNNELKNKNEKHSDEKNIANWIINKRDNIEGLLPAKLIENIIKFQMVSGVTDKELLHVLTEVLENNSKSVMDYKAGKVNAIMFLVGQAMKQLKGKEKADKVKQELEKLIK